MGALTSIAWCDSTWNPWIGCTKVSPGCDHCYASVSTPARTMRIEWGAGQPRRRTSASTWGNPLRWNARPFVECVECAWRGESTSCAPCPGCGDGELRPTRRRVFCSSLADVFDNEAPQVWRWDLFRLIAATPNLTWMLLTKRIGMARRMLNEAAAAVDGDFVGADAWDRSPWPNVWLGATIVNQEEADRDVPKLLATPAAKRFVSYEPALGPISFDPLWLRASPSAAFSAGRITPDMPDWTRIGAFALDWIIVGGESDQPRMRARPFDLQWARNTIEQCRNAGVPAFVKQVGSNARWNGIGIPPPCQLHDHAGITGPGKWRLVTNDRAGADPMEWPDDLRIQQFPC